jgi:hypothetical protein
VLGRHSEKHTQVGAGGRFPHLVESVGISDTRDQMQVSDRLLIDRAITKIVDLGSGTFDLFFAVMAKIDFVTEARRQLVEVHRCLCRLAGVARRSTRRSINWDG